MEQIISRCGNICSECPWSKFMRQKVAEEDWEHYTEKIKRYTGYKPVKYEWEGCVGCLTPTENFPSHPFFNLLKNCRTRKCAQYTEVPNCAYCGRFPCANTVVRKDYTKEKISEKLGREITDEEYEHYIKMFDGMGNLNKIRSKLSDTQIKNPKLVSHRPEITELTGIFKNDNIKFIYEKLTEMAYSNLGIKGIDTISGFELYKERRDFLWRFLWIIGLFGNIEDDRLSIDSATLYENRKPLSLPKNEEEWKIFFKILSEFGIITELEIKTDELYTPGGYMRVKIPRSNEHAYIIKMKTLPILQKYPFFKDLSDLLSKLQDASGKRAFSNFKKLNLNPILK
jgi:hypothetical protein